MGNNIKMVNGVEILTEKRHIDAVDFLAYETWLEDMELQGWNLKEIVYNDEHVFTKGQKRKVRYSLSEDKPLNTEYEQMFKDFGWILKYRSLNNYLWMMEYEGERPEAFNDMEHLKKRNKKYTTRLIIALLGAIIYGSYCFSVFLNNGKNPLIAILTGGIFLLYCYIKSGRHIKFMKAFRKNKSLIDEYLAS